MTLMEAKHVIESQEWMDTHLQEVEATLEFSPKKDDAINFSTVFLIA